MTIGNSILPRLIFTWRAFSKRVTARWSRGWEKIKCRPIRTREIGGVRLQVELCVTITRLLLRNVHQRLNRVLLLNLIHGVIIALLFFIII